MRRRAGLAAIAIAATLLTAVLALMLSGTVPPSHTDTRPKASVTATPGPTLTPTPGLTPAPGSAVPAPGKTVIERHSHESTVIQRKTVTATPRSSKSATRSPTASPTPSRTPLVTLCVGKICPLN